MNKKLLPLIIILVSLSLAGQAAAQQHQNTTYTGVQYISPKGDASGIFDPGWGLTGTTRKHLGSSMDFMIEGGWYKLKGKEDSLPGNEYGSEDLSVLSALIGLVIKGGPLEFGAKGGYFFSDLHEWDVMPFAQLALGRFAIGYEYKLLGKMNWSAVYLNYRWQK
jgi:hypothetical protein